MEERAAAELPPTLAVEAEAKAAVRFPQPGAAALVARVGLPPPRVELAAVPSLQQALVVVAGEQPPLQAAEEVVAPPLPRLVEVEAVLHLRSRAAERLLPRAEVEVARLPQPAPAVPALLGSEVQLVQPAVVGVAAVAEPRRLPAERPWKPPWRGRSGQPLAGAAS